MKGKGRQSNLDSSTVAPVTLATAVAGHPFFCGMSAAHLRMLAECAMQTEFSAGQLIFRRGDPANRFYLIEEGEVSLEIEESGHGAIFIQTLGPGGELGWSWLFAPHEWQFNARATNATRAIFFYGTWLRERCEQDVEFGYELMKRMARVMTGRLQATREQLVELSRLALMAQCQALRLATPAGAPRKAGRELHLAGASPQRPPAKAKE